MEHHGANEEDNQRVILKEHADAFGFAAFLAKRPLEHQQV